MNKSIDFGMRANALPFKYLIGWLVAGTKGGPKRAKIIEALKQTSLNTNQLSTILKTNYKTTKAHLEVLEKNKIVTSTFHKGATTYVLSQAAQKNYEIFEEMRKKVDETKRTRANRQTSENGDIKPGVRPNEKGNFNIRGRR